MSIGQRIAQKRKEQGLSQEALGEQLGVSRQSIYKWESDSALPEIEKLIALSQLFRVSVGWLLGAEEAAAPVQEEPSGELTESQLNMVQEIVDRYLAAQPKPKPRKKWPRVLLGLVLLATVFHVIHRLDQIDHQYQRVQMTVSNVQDSVNSQINGIADQVETILKAQNSLTAEYGTEIKGARLADNTITFSAYAVPKTFVEGMTATFTADNGQDSPALTVPAVANQKFSTDISCALTDSIVLSVTFTSPDGTKQTQILDEYNYLYSATLPDVDIHEYDLMFAAAPGGTLTIPGLYVTVKESEGSIMQLSEEPVAIKTVQVGLFQNKKLVAWATPVDKPDDYSGFEGHDFYRLEDVTVHLTETDQLHFAALVTDNYGRQTLASTIPYILDTEDETITHPTYSGADHDLANWTFH